MYFFMIKRIILNQILLQFSYQNAAVAPPECNCLQEPVVTANKRLWDKQLDYHWYTQILVSRI